MAGLPEITLAGTLTADPELARTDKGVAYARFTVACNDRRYDPNTRRWEDLDAAFLRCTVWRGLAEHTAACLSKGARVVVLGTVRQRTFEAADGQTHTVVEIDASEVAASLRWAHVQVRKPDRASTPATGPTAPDEPPF
jgi:single-strand DNA-binding protein